MKMLKRTLNIKSKNYLKIIKLLRDAGAKVRLVGGVVRDALIGIPTKDIDIATDFTPDKTTEVLQACNIKVIPTGIKFGTISAIIGKEVFEITTLRRDLACNGRHAHVEYSTDFKEDAERRDFTINSLSYCPVQHKIYDYCGGIDDLKARKVVFIGEANARIQEDYLRILRFFRFSCRFAKEIDDEALKACIKFRDKLHLLSKERIKSEMYRILTLEESPKFLIKMYDAGIMQAVLPISKYDVQLHKKAIEIAKSFQLPIDVKVLYAIILPSATLKTLLDLKFSRADSLVILKLLELRKLTDKESVTMLLKTIWIEEKFFAQYFIFASIFFEDNKFIYDLFYNLKTRHIPKLPIDGNDLMKLGYTGSRLGYLMKNLKNKWIQSDFALKKKDVINLAKNCEF